MNPENIVVYLYRGKLKASEGDFNGAINDYNQAIEVYPDFADAYYERSQANSEKTSQIQLMDSTITLYQLKDLTHTQFPT